MFSSVDLAKEVFLSHMQKKGIAGLLFWLPLIWRISSVGALTLASVLLYPRKLGGGAIFSGWVPFNASLIDQFTSDAKKVLLSMTPMLSSNSFVIILKLADVFFTGLYLVSSVVLMWCHAFSWFNGLRSEIYCRHRFCGLMEWLTEQYCLKLDKQVHLSLSKLA